MAKRPLLIFDLHSILFFVDIGNTAILLLIVVVNRLWLITRIVSYITRRDLVCIRYQCERQNGASTRAYVSFSSSSLCRRHFPCPFSFYDVAIQDPEVLGR